jgi:hypothetical protein
VYRVRELGEGNTAAAARLRGYQTRVRALTETVLVGHGRYCPPRHPTLLEPSFREFNGFLCRGKQYTRLPRQQTHFDLLCFGSLSAFFDVASDICQALGAGPQHRGGAAHGG